MCFLPQRRSCCLSFYSSSQMLLRCSFCGLEQTDICILCLCSPSTHTHTITNAHNTLYLSHFDIKPTICKHKLFRPLQSRCVMKRRSQTATPNWDSAPVTVTVTRLPTHCSAGSVTKKQRTTWSTPTHVSSAEPLPARGSATDGCHGEEHTVWCGRREEEGRVAHEARA